MKYRTKHGQNAGISDNHGIIDDIDDGDGILMMILEEYWCDGDDDDGINLNYIDEEVLVVLVQWCIDDISKQHDIEKKKKNLFCYWWYYYSGIVYWSIVVI